MGLASGFDKLEGVIWLDGRLVDWQDARLHVLSHGLHYASCVFEGNRAYNGKIFKLSEHSRRMENSARILGFALPLSVDALNEACRETLSANNLTEGYIRPVAWRGSEKIAISAQDSTVHLAIAAWAWGDYFKNRQQGVRLSISTWRRPAPDTAPVHAKAAGLYMICTLAKHEAEQKKFDDALMLDYRGFLAEGTGANLFLCIDGKLHTPTPDCFLDGITRHTVIDIARARGIEVIERHIRPEELREASEVFLTGTAAELTPVRQIDDMEFTVGALSETLAKAYDKTVRA